MYIDDSLLIKYKSRLEHRKDRFSKMVKKYKDKADSLSNHGYWSLGYYEGLLSEIENQLEILNDVLKGVK